jgi:hypothetical protein
VFTITSYSAFRRTTAESFTYAVEVADGFAREGNLPATITDGAGSRWTKWAGAPVSLEEGPGLDDDQPVWDSVGRWVVDVAEAGVGHQFTTVVIGGRPYRVTVEAVA